MSKKRAALEVSEASIVAKKPKPSDPTTSKPTPEGDEYWEITDKRRVTVSAFKNQLMVSIREYYNANGEMKPGKKGISLTVAQFSALIEALPAIEASLKTRGQMLPRPKYGSVSGVGKEDDVEVKNAHDNEGEGGKKNFEETSEEE